MSKCRNMPWRSEYVVTGRAVGPPLALAADRNSSCDCPFRTFSVSAWAAAARQRADRAAARRTIIERLLRCHACS
jgi:hypothetical protein